MDLSKIHYLIVDWGTTNFRAFAMSADHKLVDTKEAPLGLLQVPNGDFSTALENLLSQWLTTYKQYPIYMAGMVGSAKGWVNVSYAATPASANELINGVHSFTLPWGPKANILPGVSHRYDNDKYDVMRGEEIQLLGLVQLLKATDFTVVLPGTHSKHVEIKSGKINAFSSYLTGEFYSMLTQHSMLGKGLPEVPTTDKQSFIKGVKDSQEGMLTNRVFLAWTNRLFDQLSTESTPDYLSGMLIGYELRALSNKPIHIVGGQSLSLRYKDAAEYLGITATILSGNECFLAGMTKIITEINNEK